MAGKPVKLTNNGDARVQQRGFGLGFAVHP